MLWSNQPPWSLPPLRVVQGCWWDNVAACVPGACRSITKYHSNYPGYPLQGSKSKIALVPQGEFMWHDCRPSQKSTESTNGKLVVWIGGLGMKFWNFFTATVSPFSFSLEGCIGSKHSAHHLLWSFFLRRMCPPAMSPLLTASPQRLRSGVLSSSLQQYFLVMMQWGTCALTS